MSSRIIHIPLSGGDRKAQAKGIRHAHGLHASLYRESTLIRSAAEAKLREADRLECEAWSAIMWAGGPVMPSPGEPQAEPTIGRAINGGYDLLEAKCNRCDRISLVPLRSLRQPADTPVWCLEVLRGVHRAPPRRATATRAHPRADLCAIADGSCRPGEAMTKGQPEIPPEAARAFMRDLRAYHATKDGDKRTLLVAPQAEALSAHAPEAVRWPRSASCSRR